MGRFFAEGMNCTACGRQVRNVGYNADSKMVGLLSHGFFGHHSVKSGRRDSSVYCSKDCASTNLLFE